MNKMLFFRSITWLQALVSACYPGTHDSLTGVLVGPISLSHSYSHSDFLPFLGFRRDGNCGFCQCFSSLEYMRYLHILFLRIFPPTHI